MDQLIEFVANHWFLTLVLFSLLGLLVWTTISPGTFGAESVSPTEAIRLINHENAVLLDVRTDSEFAEGYILNAMHIPQPSLSDHIKKLDKHRSKPVIAVCRSGNRSAKACATLRKHGFERVYNLSGGIAGWQNASLPLVRK
uniref:Rhodanese-related sulfurtransferase n=1 Tax=Candidatus Kentrum eta TaxID=2126337 RepID=A0A450V1L2_9GAMM|nr:MAG: Rhodanese-related sulfurtransferase [Candidatus Kentron sp. H]VFJ99903.1 MAG: Rhodanese-related sulfurtransferase [Candidatus Kentron sp. H]VFK03656.1 MAG: Rhodanese-related sulfurtransferase [Candidatus Kentron sp. H]